MFGKSDAAGKSPDDLAAAASIEKVMGSAWAALAAGHAPDAPWLKFDGAASYPSLLIDGGSNSLMVDDLGADVCALWDTVPF